MKNFLRFLLKYAGYEMCRLSDSELRNIPHGVDMNYKEAQIYRALTTSGQISIEEARFLIELVKRSDPSRPIIEVGTLYGFSTLIICLAKNPQQKLYSVDNFSWNSLGISPLVHFYATQKRLQECIENYGVNLIYKAAHEFYASYMDANPALFFCDADHTYEAVKADISWARAVGASIVCGDDYAPEHTGVSRAVDEFGGPRELRGGLWVL